MVRILIVKDNLKRGDLSTIIDDFARDFSGMKIYNDKVRGVGGAEEVLIPDYLS